MCFSDFQAPLFDSDKYNKLLNFYWDTGIGVRYDYAGAAALWV